jgi:hypothetical protein
VYGVEVAAAQVAVWVMVALVEVLVVEGLLELVTISKPLAYPHKYK